ncbi:unnamed protein product [Staurois parvus]|uniref:Secreted protein n=1 Tax=Staurois parvus TaxID=386267 RepID=A0ABN9G8E4_9NEOB|nr:unnamed protein product [Staurois parvus]
MMLASQCALWQIVTSSARLFFHSGTLRGLLADSLASHRRLLIVTVLTGNFRPYLPVADCWLSPCHFGYSSIHSNGSLSLSSMSFRFWLPF